ncbi:MAG TPA: App1 family protein, partial [Phycisphaerae bacterium]|nr:App1 family protein [Phycisphaerae bacterium]
MLRKTFLEDFACVPEMSALYRKWQTTRWAAFHYVSASPWHLYPFLSEFLSEQQFPYGTFHLRDFRLMIGALHRTFRPSRRIKMAHCRALMRTFPQRQFILVGDSGESDPKIYARLFRE